MIWRKRAAALLWAALLAVGGIRAPARAGDSSGGEAQQGRYDINIGAELLRPTAAWNASDGMTVYFGMYSGNPVRYRILPESPGTQMPEEPSLLLDADKALVGFPFDLVNPNDSAQAGRELTNVWPDSALRAHLIRRYDNSVAGNFEGDMLSFTAEEAGAIARTALAASAGTYSTSRTEFIKDYASDDHLFLLSAKEALNLYSDDAARVKQGGVGWWTRSANDGNSNFAGFVLSDPLSQLAQKLGLYMVDAGTIPVANVDTNWIGLSPALNLKLSSVLFSSATDWEKSLAPADGAVQADDGREWKLTLRDPDKSVRITDGTCADLQADGTVLVPYTYTDAGSQNRVSQISVMITDQDYTADGARILYYGALQNIKDGSGAESTASDAESGTGTFVLPQDLPDGCRIYLVAECVSESSCSDYAGEPSQVRFHTWSEWSIEREPTIQESGVRRRTCALCGQTQQEEIPKLPEYPFLERDDGTYVLGEDGSYRVRVDADISKFVSVEVDSEVVDDLNYTLESGSTIVSLHREFMNTLSPGDHTLRIRFTDGMAEGIISVTEPAEKPQTAEIAPTEKPQTENAAEGINSGQTAPGTGDESAAALWVCLLCLSGAAALLLACRRRAGDGRSE